MTIGSTIRYLNELKELYECLTAKQEGLIDGEMATLSESELEERITCVSENIRLINQVRVEY